MLIDINANCNVVATVSRARGKRSVDESRGRVLSGKASQNPKIIFTSENTNARI